MRGPLIRLVLLIILLIPHAPGTAEADESGPLVCVYYYPWYGGPDHPWINVTDEPLLGYYNSSDSSVIARHLSWLRDLGVNCLFVSWWGPGHFTDYVAGLLYEMLPDYGLKAAILVEPYLGRSPDPYNASWWSRILAYLREHFIDEYPDVYLHIEDKPLILAYNPIGEGYNPKPDYPEYMIRIVGNGIGEKHEVKDWDLWPDYDVNLTGELIIRRDGYVALAPRFDDEHFRPGGTPQYDPDLVLGWYQRQWERILEHKGQVRIIAIYSWNEFHERSAIEPANYREEGDPYYLYNLTSYYIGLLRSGEETGSMPGNTASDSSSAIVPDNTTEYNSPETYTPQPPPLPGIAPTVVVALAILWVILRGARRRGFQP